MNVASVDPAMRESRFDVAIIGGGPAGSTTGALLKLYDPSLKVLILERERFPRDHVGESLLPLVNEHLHEMGVWSKVEEAGFPVKIGATYRWGSTPDLWNFEFLPNGEFHPQTRPGRYEGQRLRTAFQVDRSIYDKLLLDRSREVGCEVRERTKVVEVLNNGDRVAGLRTDCGELFTARHYVDCSAGSGILRRAMGVGVDSPTALRNVAIWDYWRNAEWAVEIGVGGTRIQVLSLGYGWIWFIPLGPDRTSIGLVVPADYLKASRKPPGELYAEALNAEPRIKALLTRAVSEGALQTTNDWSYVADRLTGDNWFLAGDACGFADPILSAGCTLAHASGREVAYTILEMDRGELDPSWMKASYNELHRRRIRQHIRFADYWYTANGQFTDLVAYCSEIAKDSGLDLDPDQAFQWLGTGGFANDDIGQPVAGGYTLSAVKRIAQLFAGKPGSWMVNRFNEYRLDMSGVRIEARPHYEEGRIQEVKALVRAERVLPLTGPFRLAFSALQHHSDSNKVLEFLTRSVPPEVREQAIGACFGAIEAMIAEGWVKGRIVKGRPVGVGLDLSLESEFVRLER